MSGLEPAPAGQWRPGRRHCPPRREGGGPPGLPAGGAPAGGLWPGLGWGRQDSGQWRQRQHRAGLAAGQGLPAPLHHAAPVSRQGRVLVSLAVRPSRYGRRDCGQNHPGVADQHDDSGPLHRHRQSGLQHRLELRLQRARHRTRLQP